MFSLAAYYILTANLPVNNFVVWPATASLVFWSSLTILVLGFPLRNASKVVYHSLTRSKWYLVLIPLYLVVHLVIYGILLESILIGIYGGAPAYNAAGVYFSGGFALFPHTLTSVLVSLTISPSIELLIPPYFGASISMFALFTAIAIDFLVVANIATFVQMRKRAEKIMGSIAVPLVGVTLGASCCLSIPELLAIASPSLSGLLFTPMGLFIQDIIYYLLPLSVILALALNLVSISKVAGVVLVPTAEQRFAK
jgi:hypothetical protein